MHRRGSRGTRRLGRAACRSLRTHDNRRTDPRADGREFAGRDDFWPCIVRECPSCFHHWLPRRRRARIKRSTRRCPAFRHGGTSEGDRNSALREKSCAAFASGNRNYRRRTGTFERGSSTRPLSARPQRVVISTMSAWKRETRSFKSLPLTTFFSSYFGSAKPARWSAPVPAFDLRLEAAVSDRHDEPSDVAFCCTFAR